MCSRVDREEVMKWCRMSNHACMCVPVAKLAIKRSCYGLIQHIISVRGMETGDEGDVINSMDALIMCVFEVLTCRLGW